MHRRLNIPDEREKAEFSGVTSHKVFYARDEAPDDGSGIFYRERLIAVHPGANKDEAGHLIHAYFDFLKELGVDENLKLFISIQVYDHEFDEQAKRPAIAALEWRQWKPKKPKVVFPLTGAEGVTFSMLPPPPTGSEREPEESAADEAEPIDLTAEVNRDEASSTDEKPIELVDEILSKPIPVPLELTSAIEIKTRVRAKEGSSKKERTAVEEKTNSVGIALDDKMVEAFERVQEIYELKDHDSAADFVLALARDLIRCEAGACMLTSPGNYELYVSAVAGGIDEKLKEKKYSLTKGIVGSAIQTSSVIRVSDALKDPRFDVETAEKDGIEIRDIICAPVQHEGRIRGAVELINSSGEGGFSQKDADVLSYLSSVLAEYISLYLPSREADFSERDFLEDASKGQQPKKKRISFIPARLSGLSSKSSKGDDERPEPEKNKSAKKPSPRGKKKKKRRN